MIEAVAFSIDDMARRTGLSRSFLYTEMQAGKLTTIKVGRRRLVRAVDEAAYLEAHRAGVSPEEAALMRDADAEEAA